MDNSGAQLQHEYFSVSDVNTSLPNYHMAVIDLTRK